MRNFFERKVVKNTSFLLFLAFLFILLGSSNCTLQEDIDTINVSLLELTDKTFVFEISANPISSQLYYELIDESLTPVLSDSFSLTEGHAVLRFSGLSPSKEYLLRFKKDENTILEIPFKTFGSIGFLEGYRFFNFIDLTDVDTSHVKVTIFGQFNNASNIVFNRYTCHHSPDIGMTFAKVPKVTFYKTYGKPSSEVNSSEYKIFIKPSKGKGYFRIEYIVDKSKISESGHDVEGYLSDRYFMASHEQFMLFPEISDQLKIMDFRLLNPLYGI
ncbi:hypothetical protein [Thermosipho sp. (in: thermotogales)]|jgi:hypothetical protein|uniref:hypothetical protein n=1 Tax=Thermosipho sp. (in: thermotogales) TaxID=1968895 RepID=UPI00257C974B|nr:hypothetical protein [Thermosipho sp. (in: thermotogales)]MBZ4650311.1 hypothetical protein [Thermosipho sp. (in: thermotogales)]